MSIPALESGLLQILLTLCYAVLSPFLTFSSHGILIMLPVFTNSHINETPNCSVIVLASDERNRLLFRKHKWYTNPCVQAPRHNFWWGAWRSSSTHSQHRTKWKWVVSFTLWPLSSGKNPRCPLYRRIDDHGDGLDVVTKRNICVPAGNLTPVVQPVASNNTDRVITVHLRNCKLLQNLKDLEEVKHLKLITFSKFYCRFYHLKVEFFEKLAVLGVTYSVLADLKGFISVS
jgi:hypothetical protein